MKLTINTSFQENASSPYLLILVDSEQLQKAATSYEINNLSSLVEAAQFKASLTESLPLIGKVAVCSNTVLIGMDKAADLQANKLAKIAQSIIKTSQKKFKQISIDISALAVEQHYLFALALTQAAYAFDEYKSKKNEFILENIHLISNNSTLNPQQLNLIHAVQSGQNWARDLGNRPGNICFPEYLAEQAQALAAQYPDLLKVTVINEQQMADLGMNAFIAVSKGSDRPGRVITLEYKAHTEQAPVLCEAKLPIHVVGAIAAAENMPSGHATRPGDIVKTMSGQTVEILNTDAEGRLVLCDTLTYIKRFNPALVIDIATLTGACVVALGSVLTGLFTPDDELAAEIHAAGQTSFDRVWRMPVIDDYQEQLDSPFADIANIGGPKAGSVTAACFLQRFTREYRWAHLDIAGTAWNSGAAKGATGRPVPLLLQFLANRAQSNG